MRPAEDLAKTKPHGLRIKYLGGCRCVPCRAANSRYQSARLKAIKNGKSNPIVAANKARKHIIKLSKFGIGYKTVADIAGLSRSTVFKIRSGERKNLRKLNETAILAVDENALPDSALVSAKRTNKQINWLLKEGFKKGELAKRLGYQTANLQIRQDVITAKTALKVERLYNQLRTGE